MKILFIHQSFPGQYRELVNWLIDRKEHEIVALSQSRDPRHGRGLRSVAYRRGAHYRHNDWVLLTLFDESIANGFEVMHACERLKAEGFEPDIILGHAGWGELSFLRHAWPSIPVIGFFEMQLPQTGGALDFDPEYPISQDHTLAFGVRNSLNHLSAENCALGQTPTQWQAETFPPPIRDKLYVCHEGIRTDLLTPKPSTAISLGRIPQPVSQADEIITYVSRNLEPVRGFHKFMRALPEILDARPNARVVIAGEQKSTYLGAPKHPQGFRAQMLEELRGKFDVDRLHFLGRVGYPEFVELMRVSSCHVYLTMPFVLSWSMMEAMSVGARIVASDTAPVREMIADGQEGLLVDFHAPDQLAARVIEVLAHKDDYREMGEKARRKIVETHDFRTRTLGGHLAKINSLVPKKLRITA